MRHRVHLRINTIFFSLVVTITVDFKFGYNYDDDYDDDDDQQWTNGGYVYTA